MRIRLSVSPERAGPRCGNFSANACNGGGISDLSLCNPQEVPIDLFGSLFVTDSNNSRVLGYAEANNTPNNVTARIEFGQGTSGTDFTHNMQNNGGLSASSLFGGSGITNDALANLYVTDSRNVRVLAYDGPVPST